MTQVCLQYYRKFYKSIDAMWVDTRMRSDAHPGTLILTCISTEKYVAPVFQKRNLDERMYIYTMRMTTFISGEQCFDIQFMPRTSAKFALWVYICIIYLEVYRVGATNVGETRFVHLFAISIEESGKANAR